MMFPCQRTILGLIACCCVAQLSYSTNSAFASTSPDLVFGHSAVSLCKERLSQAEAIESSDPTRAESLLQEALSYAKQSHNQSLIELCLKKLEELHKKLKQYDTADLYSSLLLESVQQSAGRNSEAYLLALRDRISLLRLSNNVPAAMKANWTYQNLMAERRAMKSVPADGYGFTHGPSLLTTPSLISTGSFANARSGGHATGRDEVISAYTRADGTRVDSYHRTHADGILENNYSFPGNTNPYHQNRTTNTSQSSSSIPDSSQNTNGQSTYSQNGRTYGKFGDGKSWYVH